MTSRERFLAACACQPLDRPPIWVMRQAGRYLPEYRQLKAKSSFLEMVRTPALATEVTLQPLKRFALDAAILFSDILVVPHALGRHVTFEAGEGPRLEPLDDISKLTALRTQPDESVLAPVYDAIRLVKREAVVDGNRMRVEEVLKDPSLCALLSDEGVIDRVRYPEELTTSK